MKKFIFTGNFLCIELSLKLKLFSLMYLYMDFLLI